MKDGASMMEKLSRFMTGRYGIDQFNVALVIVSVIISFVTNLINIPFLSLISLAIVGYAFYRSLSKNISHRQKENNSFLKVWTPVQKWFKIKTKAFKERDSYKYFKCPNCRQQLRAPKGRGKIKITCQKCHKEFTKKV